MGERAEYMRGYSNAVNKKWSKHKPPFPPEPLVRKLMEAGMNLRNEADAICASLLPDDTFVQNLGPAIDDFDDAMVDISNWLAARTDSKGEAKEGE